ncbi:hypothetical protein FHS42_004045 [Streptomyces zagrosensis]|uniref:Uncharacterized protein n=1 Tax=Streptomyces zagrosensis TaxID=1042984 RepID=A0A7W9QB20_9ACTN|nr:hypothetical protein [Streptomyces zagrosensis]
MAKTKSSVVVVRVSAAGPMVSAPSRPGSHGLPTSGSTVI